VEASLHLIEDAKPGDYILIHTGFALQKISEEEAMETFRLMKELEEFNALPGS
jgi:hydrogenase expression/formation protein HypC